MKQETRIKIVKTFKGALIAGGGVAATYFLEIVAQLDFGSYTAVVAGVAAVLINMVKEFLRT